MLAFSSRLVLAKKLFQTVPHLLYRFSKPSHRYGSNCLTTTRYDMQTAYFKHLPENGHCQISFHLTLSQLRVDKVFKLNRDVAEPIESTIDRIRVSIAKEILKKKRLKKKAKKLTDMAQAEAQPEVLGNPIDVSIGTASERFTQITVAELFERLRSNTNVFLTIMENEFQIVCNIPEVLTVSLPPLIMANCYVYPAKMILHFATNEASAFSWLRGLMPESKNAHDVAWEQVGHGLTYLVEPGDIGYHLKLRCTPRTESGESGPEVETISPNPVQAGPGQCPFEVRHLFTQNKLSGSQFRTVSYNLLADLYTDNDHSQNVLFGYCMPYALKIGYRKQLFVKEILGYQADIVCLQEVDKKIFNVDLVTVMQGKNYSGHYRSKGKVAEGLATFYDVDKFELVENDGVVIREIVERYPELWEKIKDNAPLVERIINRSNALQLTALRSRHNPKKHLLVANTHLYFHPDADHVRLLQFGLAMLYVREQYDRLKRDHQLDDTDFALLFCGDFNSVPQCGIYKLMLEGSVGTDFVDWESNKEEAVKNISLEQPFSMGSACGCPKFTNYTAGFSDCIDYIFYQKDVLHVTDVIPMPSEEELTAYHAIPSPVFPSDHIALVADLEWAV